MIKLGIDIGTSFSSVVGLKDGVPTPIRVKTGDSLFGDSFSLPTVVYVELDGEIKLGQLAYNKRKIAPERFRQDFKRDFGTKTPYLLGNGQYLPEDLYRAILAYFKQRAQDTFGDQAGATYITHPASYTEEQKKLLVRTANSAGLMDVVLMDEPTAAAVAYAQKESVEEGDVLLVYDLGGGTFDVSLIRKTASGFEHLTEPLGLPECGGIDFDRAIYNDVLQTLQKQGVDTCAALDNPRFAVMMPEVCIKLKHQLSSEVKAEEPIELGTAFYDYNLDRARFEAMIRPLINAAAQKVSAILQNAGLTAGQVSHVVMVGGSSQIPLVQQSLAQIFGKKGKLNTDIDPALAVAIGAAIYQSQEWNEEQANVELRARERREKEEAERALAEQKRLQLEKDEENIKKQAENASLKDIVCKAQTGRGNHRGELSSMAVSGELTLYKNSLLFDVNTKRHPFYRKSTLLDLQYQDIRKIHQSLYVWLIVILMIASLFPIPFVPDDPEVLLISAYCILISIVLFNLNKKIVTIVMKRDEVYSFIFARKIDAKETYAIIKPRMPKGEKG